MVEPVLQQLQVFKFGHAPPHLSQTSLPPQQQKLMCAPAGAGGMGVARSLKNASQWQLIPRVHVALTHGSL